MNQGDFERASCVAYMVDECPRAGWGPGQPREALRKMVADRLLLGGASFKHDTHAMAAEVEERLMNQRGTLPKSLLDTLFGYLEHMVSEDGDSLSVALKRLDSLATDHEWIEVQAVIGCACDYDYFKSNGIEDETATIKTPRGAWAQVERWEDFVAEHDDAMDPRRTYKDTIDVARGMSGLWDDWK